MAPMKTDWNPVLRGEFGKAYWIELQRFVAAERSRATVYPRHDEVFAALHLTPFREVKAVILGQDPYHGPNQAHGLCFSVRPGVPPPPSLQNIFKELEADLGLEPPSHGCLDSWARQGVLLLNASLTVRQGRASSHQGKGWETFTDEVLRTVNARAGGVHPVGGVGAQEEGAHRHQPARGHRVAPPVAAVGVERVLRQPSVLAGQRRARRGGTGADRLVAARASGRRPRAALTAGAQGQFSARGSGVSKVPSMCSVQVAICAWAGRPRVASVTPSPPSITWEPVPPCVNAVWCATPSISE